MCPDCGIIFQEYLVSSGGILHSSKEEIALPRKPTKCLWRQQAMERRRIYSSQHVCSRAQKKRRMHEAALIPSQHCSFGVQAVPSHYNSLTASVEQSYQVYAPEERVTPGQYSTGAACVFSGPIQHYSSTISKVFS